eukprot:Polyplicarium_translucidae@DN3254_c0_g1_i1.p1
MGETPPKCQPAAVREDAYGGKGLFAIRDITSGEIVFEDTPLFTCPTDLEGMMQFFSSKLTNEQFAVLQDVKAQFEGLTFKDEEDIAQLCLPASERSDEDAEGGKFSDGIKRCSKVVKTRYEQFRRFVCVMKCNGHGVCYNPKEWSFFPRGLRANHSCSPNVSYRNIDNRLYYIALKDIQKQEEIVMAYIDGLFASTKQRQEKLIRQKLFICQCERCADTNDPCRKVACPHCRTTKTEAPDSAKDAEAGAETEVSADYVGNNKWHCRKCTFKFDETVMPVAVEQTLQNLYHQLDVGFIQPDAQTWLHYSGYLCTTAGNILGKNHWITAGAHYLLSRYYVGMWYGGNRSEDTMKVACFHADGFFAFIETNCPEARDVDATPWSSALMRMALQACDVKAFVIYARYLNRLKLLYGPWDATFRAYQEAVRYLHNLSPEEAPNLRVLAQLAEDSKRQQAAPPPAAKSQSPKQVLQSTSPEQPAGAAPRRPARERAVPGRAAQENREKRAPKVDRTGASLSPKGHEKRARPGADEPNSPPLLARGYQAAARPKPPQPTMLHRASFSCANVDAARGFARPNSPPTVMPECLTVPSTCAKNASVASAFARVPLTSATVAPASATAAQVTTVKQEVGVSLGASVPNAQTIQSTTVSYNPIEKQPRRQRIVTTTADPFSVPHASTRSQPAPPRPPSAERPFQPVAPPATRPPEAVQIRVSADSWIPDARFTSAPATTLTGVEVMHQEPTGFQKPHGPPLMIPMPKAKQVYAMPTPHFDVLPSAYRTSVVGHPEPTPAASKERSRSPGAGHHRSITANFRDENGSRATVPVQPKPSAEDTPSHRHARPTGKGQRRHGPMPMPPSPNPLEPPPGRKSRRAAMKKPPELLGGRKPSACSPEKELLSVRKHEENPAVMPERSTIPVMMGYRPSAARVIHPQLFVNGPLLGAGHHPVIILPHGIPMQQRRGARPLFRPFPHE